MSSTAEAPDPSPLIRFRDVSKRYVLHSSPQQRARDILFGRRRVREHWALRDVDLTVAKGEAIGLIGANGAGKSTLLAMVAAASVPTAGSVEVRGRVSALLELGAGFHPDWTGRQNAEFQIRLRGHGRRDSKRLVDDVEAFADIGVHFDQPLRTCSSGMALRVAFAAAVCVEPDILIVDEALAVGDATFQHKCFRKLAEFRARGVTILLVTHRLEIVPQLCSRALFLRDGRIAFDGPPGEALVHYARSLFPAPASATDLPDRGDADPLGGYRFGDRGAAISAVRTASGTRVVRTSTGEVVDFHVEIAFERDVERPVLGFSIRSVEDVVLYVVNSDMAGDPVAPAQRGERRTFKIQLPLRLAAGTFFADFSICAREGPEVQVLDALASHVRLDVGGGACFGGLVDLGATISTAE